MHGRIEEEVDEGVALGELAQGLGVTVQTSRPLLATGQVYGTQNEVGPDVLAPVIANAFEMLEGEPQMTEIVRGETFLIYEASEITESATAPLSEINDEVTAAWRLSEGSTAAKEAADRILTAIASGSSVAAAFGAEEIDLPNAAPINLSREQLAAREGMGFAFLPHWLASDDLVEGLLEPVLPDETWPKVPISAIYPDRSYMPAKVRSFLDFLAGPMGLGQITIAK